MSYPAVLSKNVLSQIDGLVAFKLTSVQDRDAIGDWVEGQADKAQWRAMWGDMATLDRGNGLVWIPARGLLVRQQFPEKATFDSSRAPKRGEQPSKAASLEPLDLDQLKARLATVAAENEARDPKALRGVIVEKDREINRLRAELTSKSTTVARDEVAAAEKRGFDEGVKKTKAEAERIAREQMAKFLDGLSKDVSAVMDALILFQGSVKDRIKDFHSVRPALDAPAFTPVPVRPAQPNPKFLPVPRPAAAAAADGGLEGPLQKICDAIRWWNVMGIARPSQAQVAFVAGYSHKSGTWATYLARLRSTALIEGSGALVLTAQGAARAREPATPPSGDQLRATVLSKIDGPLAKIMRPIIEAYPQALSQSEAGERAGYSSSSGTWATYLSRLRSLDLIEGSRELRAQDWLFPLERAA